MKQEAINDLLISLNANFTTFVKEQKRHNLKNEKTFEKFFKKLSVSENRIESLETEKKVFNGKLSILKWIAGLGFLGGTGSFFSDFLKQLF